MRVRVTSPTVMSFESGWRVDEPLGISTRTMNDAGRAATEAASTPPRLYLPRVTNGGKEEVACHVAKRGEERACHVAKGGEERACHAAKGGEERACHVAKGGEERACVLDALIEGLRVRLGEEATLRGPVTGLPPKGGKEGVSTKGR